MSIPCVRSSDPLHRTWAVGCVVSLAALVALGSCAEDDDGGENVITAGNDSGGDDDDDDDDDDAAGPTFPAAYRFGCIDIQIIGDADGTAVQASLLESTWTNDIALYKLNIILNVLERDEEAGTATLQVTSGVGTSDDDLCAEANTISDEHAATYTVGEALWGEASDGDLCSESTDSGGAGTYHFELPPEDVIYIYAEEDGTTLNCNPAGNAPDAIPIRAIEADVTVNADETTGYGSLTGCLTEAEAMGICSCLGSCVGDTQNPDCGDCPTGATPLRSLLTGIDPSDRCTDLMGETAFDLQIGMVTELLPQMPAACG